VALVLFTSQADFNGRSASRCGILVAIMLPPWDQNGIDTFLIAEKL
jgi:hypothetical protein